MCAGLSKTSAGLSGRPKESHSDTSQALAGLSSFSSVAPASQARDMWARVKEEAWGEVPGPYQFVWFVTIPGPKSYTCIWFGDDCGPKPYKFKWFGDINGPNTNKLICSGDIHGPKPEHRAVIMSRASSRSPPGKRGGMTLSSVVRSNTPLGVI